MAKGVWISDEERDRIVQMRNDGVPVKDISKQTQRSTNYIYRLMKKINGQEPTKKKQKTTTVPDTPTASTPSETGERRDQLLDELSDSSTALLCAVEGMEVSAYEPIPMPRSVRNSEQRQPQVRPGAVNTSVAFTAEAVSSPKVVKPHTAQNSDEFWLLTDITASTGREANNQVQSLTKQKTSTSQGPTQTTDSQSSSAPSSLLVNLHLPRPQSDPKSSLDGLGGLLKRIQDEIRRLEGLTQSDIYDAQLLQMLVKFHAEMLLVQLQRTLSAGESNKRVREENMDGKETSRLLREKLAKEIALLNVQADRERLELEREQIRHKTTSMICRKTLLDANASPADVDQLFPRP